MDFSLHTPWNSFLRKPWVVHLYSTMLIWNILDGLRHKSTSTITIKTLSIIVKGTVADLLRLTFMYCTITPTFNYFIFINTIIHMDIRTRYLKQSTVSIWVMGERVAGLGPISTSTITTDSFSHIVRGKVSGLYKHKSTFSIINSYTPTWFAIITTSISPPITVIKTDINLLSFMKIFIYRMRRKMVNSTIYHLSPGLWE